MQQRAAAGAHHLSFQLAARQERDLTTNLAGAQGATQATKVTAKYVACHKDAAQRLATAMGSNPHNLNSSSSWLEEEVEGGGATPINIQTSINHIPLITFGGSFGSTQTPLHMETAIMHAAEDMQQLEITLRQVMWL